MWTEKVEFQNWRLKSFVEIRWIFQQKNIHQKRKSKTFSQGLNLERASWRLECLEQSFKLATKSATTRKVRIQWTGHGCSLTRIFSSGIIDIERKENVEKYSFFKWTSEQNMDILDILQIVREWEFEEEDEKVKVRKGKCLVCQPAWVDSSTCVRACPPVQIERKWKLKEKKDRAFKKRKWKLNMPGLPAGLSGLFHLCEGSCLCATSPNGKTNRVLYCYGEVLFNC